MAKDLELQLHDDRKDLTVPQMLQTVIQGGVTAENAAAFEKLIELHWKMQERDAERDFASAFVALQAEIPNVKAVKAVPNKDGTVRYKFAPYEEIMEQVSPLLKKHGFTVTFSTDYKDNRLIKTCTLQHTSGHSKSNSYAVRIGSGPPGSSETQADGAAATYAKRGALSDCLNIVTEKDDDANAEGDFITKEQAEELQHRVKMTNSDEKKFLKFCGVNVQGAVNFEHYREICENRYKEADSMLRQKENQGK